MIKCKHCNVPIVLKNDVWKHFIGTATGEYLFCLGSKAEPETIELQVGMKFRHRAWGEKTFGVVTGIGDKKFLAYVIYPNGICSIDELAYPKQGDWIVLNLEEFEHESN